MPFNFGALELGLILFVILIIFGAGKLPQLGKNLGGAIKEFKQATKGDKEEREAAK